MAWSRLPLPENTPEATRCIQLQIPDDPEYTQLFIGMLTWMSFWDAYDRDLTKRGKDVAALWRNTLHSITTCETCDETAQETINEMIHIAIGCVEENETEEMALQIIKRNNIPYLVETCCGGQSSWYELSSVAVDDNGDPISGYDGGSFGGGFSTGGGASGSWDFNGVSSENVSCYADVATDYLTDRAIEFAHTVIDWTALGLDAFSGNLDEYLEVARLISDLIFGTGDMTEIQNLTKSQVSTALKSSAVIDALASAWTFPGTATRSELRNWVGAAPILSSGVPVRFLLNQWLGFSIIAGYNDTLARLASECESGNTTPNPPVPICSYDWIYEFDIQNLGKQGWSESGGGAIAVYDVGEGFARGATASTDYLIQVYYAGLGVDLVAIEIELQTAMNGGYDRIYMANDGSPIVDDQGHTENPVVYAFDEPTSFNNALLGLYEHGNSGTSPQWQAGYMRKIRLYGIGTPPATGIDVTP